MVILRRWQTEAGLASRKASAAARGVLDPIDAARNDIAGSKDLIASVSDDLSQHYRWLENYRSSEIRHKRRLKRQAVIYQAEFHGHRLARFLKRTALTSFRLARNAGLALWRFGQAVFLRLHALVSRISAWMAPYARAVAMVFVIGFVWLVLELRAVALGVRRASAASWSWLQEKGGVLARNIAKATSIISAWLAVNLRAFARLAWRQLAAAWAWIKVHAGRFARASAAAAAVAFAWLAVNGKALALDLGRWLSSGASWLGAKLKTFGVWLEANLQTLARATFAIVAIVSARIAMKSREMSRPP